MEIDLEEALEIARRAVSAAGEVALRHFRRGVAVETKPDHSPVTAADRDAEAVIVETVRAAFPEHGFLGEETGAQLPGADSRWIVDPIDGTRGFIRGGSFWGPLLALEHRGQIVAGAMAMPALGETYWAAQGLGAWRDGLRLRVSGIAAWSEATLSLGQLPGLIREAGVLSLVDSAWSARAFGDLAGCAMVLNGQAEAWLEAGVQTWDLAPLKILIEEAGGRFTDFAGHPTVEAGCAVATNGKVHDHVLGALRRTAATAAGAAPPPRAPGG